MRKFITSIFFLLSVAVIVIFIIFVVNMGSNNTPSQQPQNVIKAKNLSVLKIASVGKTVSEGVVSEEYAFKTKDNGTVQIGTERHSPPKPYVKMDKWDGEVSLKIQMPFETGDNPQVRGDKLRYSTADKPVTLTPWQKLIPLSYAQTPTQPRVDIDIYPMQPDSQNEGGGMEFDTIFYEKPTANQIVFPIETANLDFFYQPPLNQEYKASDKGIVSCTQTDCYDKNGQVIDHRPENVVGSYAVYYKDGKSGDYTAIGGKNYTTGKAFHIYRPEVSDAKGNKIWGDMNINTDTGTLTITVDQNWLDNATYPVTVDPLFGSTDIGGNTNGNVWMLDASRFTAPDNGTISSITVYLHNYTSGGCNINVGYYNDNAGSVGTQVAHGTAVNPGDLSGYYSINVTGSIVKNNLYFLAVQKDSSGGSSYSTFYDLIGEQREGYNTSHTFNDWGDNPSGMFYFTDRLSIYATYAPSAMNMDISGLKIQGINIGTTVPWPCGNLVNFTYNGNPVIYRTVSHNGACWMDRNLGASEVATAYNDTRAYGDLFQWGRLADGHQLRTSGITTNLSGSDNPGNSNFIYGMGGPTDWRSPQNDNLWQGVSGINNPCPPGWRIPTQAEWTTEYSSWSSQDYNGAFASPLKLTEGGTHNYFNGLVVNVSIEGYYWSSTVNYTYADYLSFYNSFAGVESTGRANGDSVRCIQNP